MKKYYSQDFLPHDRNLNLTHKFEALSGEKWYQNFTHIRHEIRKVGVEIYLHHQMCLSLRKL